MASLFVVRGRDQGKHFPLKGEVVKIGRDKSNTVQLLDTEASRVHAEIRATRSGRYELLDLHSSNGTILNGISVRREVLASGDRLEIGGTLLIFTSTGHPSLMDAAHGVDIVYQSQQTDGSRIVSSIASSSGALRTGSSRQVALSRSDADRSLEVMYRTAIAVGRTDDLGELLNRILWLVFDWVEADRGCVMLRDNESGQFQPAARCDRDVERDVDRDVERSSVGDQQARKSLESQRQARAAPSSQRIFISQTILDYVLERKEGVRTSDARDDIRFESAASIVSAGVREAICVPLQGRYDIVGALYVDTYTNPSQMVARDYAPRFTDDHLRLITAIGHQAALAIEDTFYYSALVQGERLAAMGQTIATLSHHIKNILQGIRGGSYLIEAGLQRDDTDAVRRGWRIVDRNQERISNLVLDMLTFSKERTPQCVEADLNETVNDVVELMHPRSEELDVLLVSELAQSMPDASFDPDALHRAILNLVTNAIDATSEHAKRLREENEASEQAEPTSEAASSFAARVKVSTRFHESEGWFVDVEDNGPGVAEEDREKIFSLFESRKGARGTGLGLPVSAKIMQEHGGDIQVLTAASGQGSCFRLRLPNASGDTGIETNELSSRETML